MAYKLPSQKEKKEKESSFEYKHKKIEDTKSFGELEKIKESDLDEYETFIYRDMKNKGLSHENSLQIIINQVEGDYSQLSPKLSRIAKKEDKEMGVSLN